MGLGPKINAFLFSQYGLKYLRALLEYHFAAGTLYSDAYYKVDPSKNSLMHTEDDKLPLKGVFHLDMPTLRASLASSRSRSTASLASASKTASLRMVWST